MKIHDSSRQVAIGLFKIVRLNESLKHIKIILFPKYIPVNRCISLDLEQLQ